MKRKDVYSVIDSERNYQDAKWHDTGSSDGPGTGSLDRSLDEFILYIHVYADKLVETTAHGANKDEKLDFVRKVAGLCVACMEAHGGKKRLNYE